MKKTDQKKTTSHLQFNKETEFQNIKTTNVNILLNRVRKDKRNTLKKRILVSFLFVIVVISVFLFLNI